MVLWLWFKPSALAGFLWHCSDRGSRNAILLLTSECRSPGSPPSLCCHPREVPTPHIAFTDAWVVASLSLGSGESPDSPLGLPWHHPVGRRRGRGVSLLLSGDGGPRFPHGIHWHCKGSVFVTTQQGWKTWLPTQPPLTPTLVRG